MYLAFKYFFNLLLIEINQKPDLSLFIDLNSFSCKLVLMSYYVLLRLLCLPFFFTLPFELIGVYACIFLSEVVNLAFDKLYP